jgi:hypothetical protein
MQVAAVADAAPGKLLKTIRAFHGCRKEAIDAIFDRAVERGEVNPEHLTERIKSLPFDLLRHEVLTSFAPAAGQTLREIVDTIFLPLVAPGPGMERRIVTPSSRA